jgi:hypothetical protein
MVGNLIEEPRVRAADRAPGVEGNARLTGTVGAVLFALLAIEGVTILRIHDLLSAHVFVGVTVTALVVTKLASVGYRFARYYLGDPDYVRKGAPNLVLRIDGPIVVLTTVAVVATGIAGLAARRTHWLIDVHKTTFYVWLAAMTVHVVGHLLDTPRLAVADYRSEPTGAVAAGARLRRLATVLTLAAGLLLAYVVVNSGWMDAWHHLAER